MKSAASKIVQKQGRMYIATKMLATFKDDPDLLKMTIIFQYFLKKIENNGYLLITPRHEIQIRVFFSLFLFLLL